MTGSRVYSIVSCRGLAQAGADTSGETCSQFYDGYTAYKKGKTSCME